MPRRKSGSGIDDQIRNMALRFATEISRVVRGGIASEVNNQVSRVLEGITRGGAPLRLSPTGTSTGDRRIGKAPVPVTCPVPGCKNVGIRAKRNFCGEHSTSLSEAEKKRLRDQQLSTEKEPKAVGRGKKRGAAKAAGAAKPAAPKPRKGGRKPKEAKAPAPEAEA